MMVAPRSRRLHGLIKVGMVRILKGLEDSELWQTNQMLGHKSKPLINQDTIELLTRVTDYSERLQDIAQEMEAK